MFGEGNGTPLQYSCLENPMDGGAWWAAIYGVAQSRTRLKQLSSRSSSSVYVSMLLSPFVPPSPFLGFPGGPAGKESTCNEGDMGSIPGVGRSPGEGNGNPLQYSYLEDPMDGGAWWAAVHGVAKSRTQLSTHAHTHRRVVCASKMGANPSSLSGKQKSASLAPCLCSLA